ncbi:MULTISPECIES: YhcN/YlaJ family sporulation lipoprotein [Bacillus]|uniref:YhcN/YlaJ family sporulation lipoprotein n=1 Tax=Bacillus TaxID=1386 RepID=UPI000BB6794F|nr:MULTISPECIES: YhcN/YlaJ family sporulation lipoprotein [Bacillus]
MKIKGLLASGLALATLVGCGNVGQYDAQRANPNDALDVNYNQMDQYNRQGGVGETTINAPRRMRDTFTRETRPRREEGFLGRNVRDRNERFFGERNVRNNTGNNGMFGQRNVRNTQQQEPRMVVADKATDRVTDLAEVRTANVIVTNRNAYVAAVLDDGHSGQLTRDVENKIEKAVKQADPDINNVFVSVNPDFVDRMGNYSNDIQTGRPVTGFMDEFMETVRRVFPTNATNNRR